LTINPEILIEKSQRIIDGKLQNIGKILTKIFKLSKIPKKNSFCNHKLFNFL